jgi:hypothetical protein
MSKLLERYILAPTYANAQKVRAYDRKHPMASMMLNGVEGNVLATAIHHANSGIAPSDY